MFDMNNVRNYEKKRKKKLNSLPQVVITRTCIYFEFSVLQFSRLVKLLLLILTLIHRKVVRILSGGIYIRKEKKMKKKQKQNKTLICWRLMIAEDTLFCFQSVEFSEKFGLWSTYRLSNDCHSF